MISSTTLIHSTIVPILISQPTVFSSALLISFQTRGGTAGTLGGQYATNPTEGVDAHTDGHNYVLLDGD